jgi:uncharacterized membrane protein
MVEEKKKVVLVSANNNGVKNHISGKQPTIHGKKLTAGQKAADWLAKWAGSWTFIILFAVCLFSWVTLNSVILFFGVWDQYPFILLNLFLSCVAAIQAPIILMSQNRQSETDRLRASYDYLVNRKAEREVKQLQIDVLEIKEAILKQSTRTQTSHLREEIKKIQEELTHLERKLK